MVVVLSTITQWQLVPLGRTERIWLELGLDFRVQNGDGELQEEGEVSAGATWCGSLGDVDEYGGLEKMRIDLIIGVASIFHKLGVQSETDSKICLY